MKTQFNILAVGDIVGIDSCDKLSKMLNSVKKEYCIDLTVANGENAASGNGLDKSTAEFLLGSGIDVLTSGNHIWQKREMQDYIGINPKIVRPANYPLGTPGKGFYIVNASEVKVLIINLLGTVFMEPLSSPFETADSLLSELDGKYDISVIDIHAEATAEKIALANYLDGRVTAVFGTHTHVQTSDSRVLPNGTGYITDLGMCGAIDSVLGVKKECIIRKFLTHMPVRFENPVSDSEMNGAVFTIDRESKKTLSVTAIKRKM